MKLEPLLKAAIEVADASERATAVAMLQAQGLGGSGTERR